MIGFVIGASLERCRSPGDFLQHPWCQLPRVLCSSGEWERKEDTWARVGKEPGKLSERRAWTSVKT